MSREVMQQEMERARQWIASVPHGDNCFVSSHYEGDPGDRCNCGKDTVLDAIDEAMEGDELAKPDAKAQPVWLVATGEVYEGQETYTRHDHRPALCDAEKLYTAPQPPAEQGAGVHDELSDEEILDLDFDMQEGCIVSGNNEDIIRFARVVIAADRKARGGSHGL